MGRVTVETTIENGTDAALSIRCDALVDTEVAYRTHTSSSPTLLATTRAMAPSKHSGSPDIRSHPRRSPPRDQRPHRLPPSADSTLRVTVIRCRPLLVLKAAKELMKDKKPDYGRLFVKLRSVGYAMPDRMPADIRTLLNW